MIHIWNNVLFIKLAALHPTRTYKFGFIDWSETKENVEVQNSSLYKGNVRLQIFSENYFPIRWCVKLLECQFRWQRGESVLNRAVSKYAYWEDGSTVVARKEKAKICMHSTKWTIEGKS